MGLLELVLTNPLTWKAIGAGLSALGLHRYFRPDRRAKRAELYARLAKDVLAMVADRQGLSDREAAVAAASVDKLKNQLIHEGVKRKNARAIAERLLAGAARPGPEAR